MDYRNIYESRLGDLMKVFGIFSGGASSLRAMIDDPNRGEIYELTGVLTDKSNASGIGYMKEAGLPVEIFDYKRFHERGSREGYFVELSRLLKSYRPDIITLSGFMLLIPDFFLQEYQNRILNVHPADLSILTGSQVERLNVGNLSPSEVALLVEDNQLKRKYVGDSAVYDSVIAGEEQTLSTIHLVHPGVDTGPILVQSNPFMVNIPSDLSVEEYSQELQEKMKWEGDGPAYLKALELLSLGRLAIGNDNTVYLSGEPLPYKGIQTEN